MNKEDEKKIAQKFAPVLCCELSKDRDKRKFDCFSSIKFKPNKNPWEMEDRKADFITVFNEGKIIPSIYYSLVETNTHYFLLYTVYHALDQKSPFGHEHDMEHIQVVVRKSEEIVEYVTTMAHHGYFYYVNEDNPVRPHPPYLNTSENGKIALYKDTHPVVYVQPGDGSIVSVFNEKIGHGIFGIGGVYKGPINHDWSKKWHAHSEDFEFESKDEDKPIGIIAMNPDDNKAEKYQLKNGINRVRYQLESVEDTIWQWFKQRKNESMGKLFKKEEIWEPSDNKIWGEKVSRKEYFKNRYTIDKVAYPSGVCGTKDTATGRIRTAAGSWPFEYINRVTGRRFSYVAHRPDRKLVPAIDLDVFFDPAAAYKIMVTAQEPIDIAYTYHPFVENI